MVALRKADHLLCPFVLLASFYSPGEREGATTLALLREIGHMGAAAPMLPVYPPIHVGLSAPELHSVCSHIIASGLHGAIRAGVRWSR